MFRYELPDNNIITFDLHSDYKVNPKENTDELIYKIVNLVHNFSDYEEVYKGYQLVVKRIFNSENLPKYWEGTIHSKNYINMFSLYNATEFNWIYTNQYTISKSFNSNKDTIIENKFTLKNMQGTYKSPEYIFSLMKKCIDELDLQREIHSLEFNLNTKLEIN